MLLRHEKTPNQKGTAESLPPLKKHQMLRLRAAQVTQARGIYQPFHFNIDRVDTATAAVTLRMEPY